MRIAVGDTVITGAGGSASIRIDVDRNLQILERSVWTWDVEGASGSGDTQQGEVHVYQAQSASHASLRNRSVAPAGSLMRVYAEADWRLVLFSSLDRTSAQGLLHHLELNGFPATLVDAAQAGKRLYTVSIEGFDNREDATAAAQFLKGKLPGVDEPRVERSASIMPPPEVKPEAPVLDARQPERGALSHCSEWGPLHATELAQARTALAQISPDLHAMERRVEDAPRWWVFIPPRENRKAAIKKVNELRGLGIRDYFIVQKDPSRRFAISLGIYSTKGAATARLSELKAHGVHSARIGRRTGSGPKVFLQVFNGPEQAQLAELTKLFPGTEIGTCTSKARGP